MYATRDITLSLDTASLQGSPSSQNVYTNKNNRPLMWPCDVFLVVFLMVLLGILFMYI